MRAPLLSVAPLRRPERLHAIMARLHAAGLLARCRLLAARPATPAELRAVQSTELVDAVLALPAASPAAQATAAEDWSPPAAPAPLSADTLASEQSREAVLTAAGIAADVGAALARAAQGTGVGAAGRALAIIRPPGSQVGRLRVPLVAAWLATRGSRNGC